MIQKFRKLSLESQLFLSFMAVSICLLLLSLSITLFSTITRQRQEIDKNISALASYIASMDNVISMLENGYPDDSAIEELDSLSENFSDLNVIAVYNTNGLRFYHTNRQETGETFVGGEEEAILKGSQPYITTGYGTHGPQRRAFHAVLSKDVTSSALSWHPSLTRISSSRCRRSFLPIYWPQWSCWWSVSFCRTDSYRSCAIP